jgi:hypothetical protein
MTGFPVLQGGLPTGISQRRSRLSTGRSANDELNALGDEPTGQEGRLPPKKVARDVCKEFYITIIIRLTDPVK